MNPTVRSEKLFQHVNRKNSSSKKWDGLIDKFGAQDIIPMSIADMDFNIAESIQEDIKSRTQHGVFGYVYQNDMFFDAIVHWHQSRHNWHIHQEWITTTPGVIAAQALAILALSDIGDEIIVQTPIYPPFFSTIQGSNRKIVDNPLRFSNGKYVMDFNDLRNKITPKTKMILLCSPHNPTGRCWTYEELKELADIAVENNLIVVSDEVFGDIIFDNNDFISIASINKEIADLTVTCTSPSKAFNLAGLTTSYSIISNKAIRDKFRSMTYTVGIDEVNSFGLTALIAAYNKSTVWLDKLIPYLEDNRRMLELFIETRLPEISIIHPEATFMAWLDCRRISENPEELEDFFVNKAKIGFKNGFSFGPQGKGFMRMSFACNHQFLIQCLEKIELALIKYKR